MNLFSRIIRFHSLIHFISVQNILFLKIVSFLQFMQNFVREDIHVTSYCFLQRWSNIVVRRLNKIHLSNI